MATEFLKILFGVAVVCLIILLLSAIDLPKEMKNNIDCQKAPTVCKCPYNNNCK